MKRCFLTWMFLLLVEVMAFAQQHQRYDFNGQQLGDGWQYVEQPDRSKYVLMNGCLRLYGSVYDLNDRKPTTFLGIPQKEQNFTAETHVPLFDFEDGDEAGMALFFTDSCFVESSLINYRSETRIKLRFQFLNHSWLMVNHAVGQKVSQYWLRVVGDERAYTFYYSFDGKKYTKLDRIDRRLLTPAISGTTAAPLIGLFAFTGTTKYQSGYSYADFDYFDYRAQ